MEESEWEALNLNYYRLFLRGYQKRPSLLQTVSPPVPPPHLYSQLEDYLEFMGWEDLLRIEKYRKLIAFITATLDEKKNLSSHKLKMYEAQVEALEKKVNKLLQR